MDDIKFRIDVALEIVDAIVSLDTIDKSLQDIMDLYNVSAIYFQVLKSGTGEPATVRVHGAGILDWMEQYTKQRLFELDPIVKLGKISSLPIDWATIDRMSPDTAQFFSEFVRFGHPPMGMTFPVHDAEGGAAILSVVPAIDVEMSWNTFRCSFKSEFNMLALYLHEKVKKHSEPHKEGKTLSRQENACLQLFADGNRPARIGDVIGISVHTVRMHLRRAQSRLGARSKAEAVAKGISLGLIRSQLTEAWCFAIIAFSELLPEFEMALPYF